MSTIVRQIFDQESVDCYRSQKADALQTIAHCRDQSRRKLVGNLIHAKRVKCALASVLTIYLDIAIAGIV